ncbi:hypothetical protein MABM_01960 [Mycobacteroides abscessus]|nr:hypothetical protein MABM_01960 [Mycobacteroides abscessus]
MSRHGPNPPLTFTPPAAPAPSTPPDIRGPRAPDIEDGSRVPRDTFSAGSWPGATAGPYGAGLGGGNSADAVTPTPAASAVMIIATHNTRIMEHLLPVFLADPPTVHRSCRP